MSSIDPTSESTLKLRKESHILVIGIDVVFAEDADFPLPLIRIIQFYRLQ